MAGIIGSNGAGKTTFFNLLTGILRADEGTILYKGEDITRLSPAERVARGMMRTFQLTSTFDNLSVIDNLVLSYFRAHARPRSGRCSARAPRVCTARPAIVETLETFDLQGIRARLVRSLSLGEKRRLEIAMAILAEPKVLLLDEPLAGLAESEIKSVLDVLRRQIGSQTILIVEHKISHVEDFSAAADRHARRPGHRRRRLRGVPESPGGSQKLLADRRLRKSRACADASSDHLTVQDLKVSHGESKVLFDIDLHRRAQRGRRLRRTQRRRQVARCSRASPASCSPQAGRIESHGKLLNRAATYDIARLGIKYMPQDKKVFSDLTVRENLELGSYATKDYNWDPVTNFFPKLKELMDRKAGHLSGGERQMLMIGRAILGQPKVLLIDEPTEGLAPSIVAHLKHVFTELSKNASVIVEQNLPLVCAISTRSTPSRKAASSRSCKTIRSAPTCARNYL